MNLSEKIIVIDDFYKNPLAVRDLALSLEFENESTPNYPGYQSKVPCVSPGVFKKFEELAGTEIDLEASRQHMGYFRYILNHGTSRLHVHTDLVDWTAVVYLTPDPDQFCGTSFYRHKGTGLYGPPDRNQMMKFKFDNFTDYENQIVEKDTLDSNAWEVVREIENRFNRCVMFRSSELFHSHSRAFGTDRASARLTQNFFFKTKKAAYETV